MIRKIYFKQIFISLFLFFTIFIPAFTYAQTTLLPSQGGKDECENECSLDEVSPACKKYCGAYSLNDIVQVGVQATLILLAISGSVALLFFIYGGVTFLISGGSAEKVSKGKQIITNSIIGIVIIFTSFIIIQYSMKAIGYKGVETWYQSK